MAVGDLAVHSTRARVSPRRGEDAQSCLEGFLKDYALGLQAAGCMLVGHIKGALDAGEGKPLFFSLLSLVGKAVLQGGPLPEKNVYILSMNSIVSGLERKELERVFRSSLQNHFHWGAEEETLGEESHNFT